MKGAEALRGMFDLQSKGGGVNVIIPIFILQDSTNGRGHHASD